MKLSVNKRIILDLCGGTGAWSKPYAEAGYDVRIITLPHYPLFEEKPGDVRAFELPNEPVYGILAAPPCTMFSLARQNTEAPRDFNVGMEIVAAVMNIIWKCRLREQLAFWALENPTGYLRQFLGKPPVTFKPCEFGDPIAKRTDLWGYFNFPKKLKEPTKAPVGNHKNSANYPRDPIERAITPPCFARAFFKANR